MHDRLFEAALGIAPPWFVAGVCFDEASKVLTVGIDFTAGSRFAVDGATGEHPVYDTVIKIYRHLNFFQHECVLEVRTPRVKLPDGSVHLVKPPFAGKLSGFTLLFEALVLILARQMPFAAVARIGASLHIGCWQSAGAMWRWRCRPPTSARSRRWLLTRPRVPAATTTSPWRPMHCSDGCWPWPKGVRPRPSRPSPPS
jgi:Helix-turn-helix domain of transposase family ISL3